MFEIYAVLVIEGQRRRELIGKEGDESIARRCAQLAASRYARYAYIKDTLDGTIVLVPRSSALAASACAPPAHVEGRGASSLRLSGPPREG